MTLTKRLSLRETAKFLGTTADVVLRMVLEERTLPAVVVGPHGGVQALRFAGLSSHHVHRTGVVTVVGGGVVGNLRFKGTDIAKTQKRAAAAKAPASQATVSTPPASIVTLPDHERRLKRLRELGGDAVYKNGEWKFPRITALEEEERAAGRMRVSQKTIREDLRRAAQEERDARIAAKAANKSDGWVR